MKFKKESKTLNTNLEKFLEVCFSSKYQVKIVDGKLHYWLSIFGTNPRLINIDSDDPMEWGCICPYCGEKTTIGKTLMIHGYIGCTNCFWADGGLAETVRKLDEQHGQENYDDEFYKRGYRK